MGKPMVGLTGGIGAGKTSVGRLLMEFGGRVIESDQLAHEVLGEPELAADPRFRDNRARMARRQDLADRLAGHFKTRDSAAWLAALEDTMARHGVAIEAARGGFVAELSRASALSQGPFPRARLALAGEVTAKLAARYRTRAVRSRAPRRTRVLRSREAPGKPLRPPRGSPT